MKELSKYSVGEKSVYQKRITDADAAHNYGSKKLSRIFATPGLVAMVIEASVEMIDERLDDGIISVGIEMGVTHTSPTKVGETVSMALEIVKVSEEDHAIFIKFEAFDEIGLVAEGIHVRNIVTHDSLFRKADERIHDLHM